jgi:hypothetical protein
VEVAAAELQTKTKALLLEQALKENASLKAQLNEAGIRISAEKANAAAVVAQRDKTIAEQSASLVAITADRDLGRRKIEKANRRRLCRKLHLFCVK